MGVSNRLVFDVSDADSIAASSSVGAFVRSDDGTLITHHTVAGSEHLDVYGIMADAGGDALTSTLVGSDQALDVNIVQMSGQFAEDSVHSSGDLGDFVLAVRNDSGSPLAADGDYIPFTTDSTGALRVTSSASSAEFAEDSAFIEADIGSHNLSVRQDTLASSTSADGDYASMKSNSLGEVYVTDSSAIALLTTIDVDTGSIATDAGTIVTNTGTIAGDTTSIDASITSLTQEEDAVHASGDKGIMGLAVRNDTLASLVSADGDYAPLQVNSDGALYVTGVDIEIDDTANTAIENTSKSVTTTTGALLVSELSNRKYLYAQNLGNKHCYIGKSGVTTANGLQLPPGVIMEFRLGAALSMHGVAQAGTQDVRIMELS